MAQDFGINLFDGMSVEPPTVADIEGRARAAGYTVNNGVASRRVGKGPSSYVENTPVAALGLGGGTSTFLDQASSLLERETAAKQKAADRQFARNNEEISGFRSFLNGATNAFDKATSAASSDISQLMGNIDSFAKGQGDDVKSAIAALIGGAKETAKAGIAGIDKVTGNILATATGDAGRAEAAARDAVDKYNTGIQEDVIKATIAGLDRSIESDIKSVQNGLGPNGTKLSPAEQAVAMRQLRQDKGLQITQMAATVRAQAQGVLAGLRTNVANVILQASQTKLAAGQTALEGEKAKAQLSGEVTQARTTGLSALLNSQEGQRAMKSLFAGLGQFKAQLGNANKLASMNYQLEGRTALADMVRNNPETVIGVLSAFLAMGGVATAPGGRNIPALRGF